MIRRAATLVIAAVVAAPFAQAAAGPGSAEADDPAGGVAGGPAASSDPVAGSGSDPGAGAGSAAGSGGGPGSPSSAGSGAGSGSGAGQLLRLPVDAGAPDVRAAASPTVVRLGGHFTLYVTATFGDGVEVNLREPVALGPAFEVRRKLSEDRRSAGGRTTREWQIDVTPWELGDLQIDPIAVTFTASGRAAQVRTNAVPLKIIGELGDVVDDPRAMRGLASPAGLAARDWFWIWAATAAGAVVGIVIAALWLGNRRSRRGLRLVGGAIARPRRIDMTGERALERLLAIEQSGVLEREHDRKIGYADMVEVIRAYLGARYRIASHDLTSLELLGRLELLAQRDEVELVSGWLAGCDVVKYGGQRATPADAGKALDDARALIVTTTVTTQRRAAPPVSAAKEAA